MGKNLNKFQLIVLQRIADHKEAEEKRLEAERERIRQEEAAKANKQPEPEPEELPLAAENKQLADEYISSTVNGMLSGRGPSPEKNISRPSNVELTQVIANHYGVKPIVAAGWLKEMAVAA